MRKKMILPGSFLLLAVCLLFFKFMEDQSFSVRNGVLEVSEETLKNGRKEAEKLDFSCLLCNSVRVPFDDEGKTFYVSLDMNDGSWEIMNFLSGQKEYGILFLEDPTVYDKQEVLAGGQKFSFLVYDEENYAEYYLTFSGLPLIDLSTDVGMWQEELEGNAVFYDTDFLSEGVTESKYQAHLRGNTSRMYPKKGYKLNLLKDTASETTVSNQQSLFGMRKDDDWILYAMYNDESKIRDRLSIDIWNAFGAGRENEKAVYGTNLTYVELIVDNSYCGLYGLMEPVDSKQLNLSAEDYLYKRKNPGGLVYEKFSAAEDPLEEVEGFKIKAGAMNESAWKPLAELSWLLYGTSDEEFVGKAPELMDEDSAMRMWLFIQIITGHDQRGKNVFYAARYEKDHYKFYFAPWDMDLTWGNVSVGEENPLFTAFEWETYDDHVQWETAERMLRLDVQGIAGKMQDLYKELREGILSDQSLELHIRELDKNLRASGAYERDRERWPEGAHTEDCELLLNYAKARMNFLDQALEDLDDYLGR